MSNILMKKIRGNIEINKILRQFEGEKLIPQVEISDDLDYIKNTPNIFYNVDRPQNREWIIVKKTQRNEEENFLVVGDKIGERGDICSEKECEKINEYIDKIESFETFIYRLKQDNPKFVKIISRSKSGIEKIICFDHTNTPILIVYTRYLEEKIEKIYMLSTLGSGSREVENFKNIYFDVKTNNLTLKEVHNTLKKVSKMFKNVENYV